MDITMKFISEKLFRFKPCLYIGVEENTLIKGVKILNDCEDPLESDILYIIKSADISSRIKDLSGINLLWIKEDAHSDLVNTEGLNLILIINEKLESNQILNIIQDHLLVEYRFASDSQYLMKALIEQKGIQHIVNKAYKLIKNPIFILDNSYRLIAKTDHQLDDPIWRDLMAYGYFSYENIRLSKIDHRNEKITMGRKMIYIDVHGRGKMRNFEVDYEYLGLRDEYLGNSRVVYNIFHLNKKLGSITVIEHENDLNDYQFRLIEILAKVIYCQMMSYQYYKTNNGLQHVSIFKDLLDEKINNHDILKERLKSINLKVKKYFYVFCVSIRDSLVDRSIFLNSLNELIPESKSIVYEDFILFLINRDEEGAFPDFHSKKIESYLGENGLYGGLSYCFDDLLRMKKYFEQAVKSIELGLNYYPNKNLLVYEKISLIHLIDLAKGRGNILDICHPALFKLMEYDQKHGQSYTKTLQTFLCNAMNFVKTANVLSIHRNSLSYRITKIEGIIGSSLTDSMIAHHLYVSFLIISLSDRNDELEKLKIVGL